MKLTKKLEDGTITVYGLRALLDQKIKEGKGNWPVYSEGCDCTGKAKGLDEMGGDCAVEVVRNE